MGHKPVLEPGAFNLFNTTVTHGAYGVGSSVNFKGMSYGCSR
jgi:hypothetical protein